MEVPMGRGVAVGVSVDDGLAVEVGVGVSVDVGKGVAVGVTVAEGVAVSEEVDVAVVVGVAGAVKICRAASTWILGRETVPPDRSSRMKWPLPSSAPYTSLTEACGFFDRRTAQAPATCGAAIDVPAHVWKPPPGIEERMLSPGAKKDRKLATLENTETRSLSVVELTLMALEMQAGYESAARDPPLPAAITVATPTDRRLSMAGFRLSPSQAVVLEPPPRLRLTAAIAKEFLRVE